VTYLVLLNNALKVALIALVVNVVATVVVEVVVEVEAVVACNLKLGANTSTITCNVVVDRVGITLVVKHHGRCIERVV
jgi:hypothetical protein